MPEQENWAAYLRTSTEEQSQEHQLEDVKNWIETEELEVSEVEFFSEYGSGASSDRDEFNELLERIPEYTDIIVWEISRIARKGSLAQQFFDLCEEHEVVIHVTNGSVREIRPDGTGRLVADIIASVAAEERRNLIRRTKSGQQQAIKAGKWSSSPPVGFRVENGYLEPILNPDRDEAEVGYFELSEVLEKIDTGDLSYNKGAEQLGNVTRQTLSNIHNGERLSWYLGREAGDERVAEALESL